MKNLLINIALLFMSGYCLYVVTAFSAQQIYGLKESVLFISISCGAVLFKTLSHLFKKHNFISRFIILAAAVVPSSILAVALSYCRDVPIYNVKIIAFLSMGVVLCRMFSIFLVKGRKKTYWIFAVVSALFVTDFGISLNSYWHCLLLNNIFPEPTIIWREEWLQLIQNDIAYNIGFVGTMRYPTLFLTIITLFIFAYYMFKKQKSVYK